MKRTYQPSNLVRKKDMVLEQEWLPRLKTTYSEGELKEEKLYQLRLMVKLESLKEATNLKSA